MSRKTGMSPGTLVHVGRRFVEHTQVRVHRYDAEASSEAVAAIDALPGPDGGRIWVDVVGVHDSAAMEAVERKYGAPRLQLEDVMSTHQRPKFEEDGSAGFVVLRMLQWHAGLEEEQVALWWQSDVLVSFQERPGDCFGPVRQRLHTGKGRIRSMPCHYLAYALVDAVVDNMFVVLEELGEDLAELEEAVLADWRAVSLADVQRVRSDLLQVRRATSPLRDVASGLLRAEGAMGTGMRPFLRDLHDHVVQVLDQVEAQRELVANLRDLWMNAQGAHMNRVMQTLTVVATIFIPLTFLAGVYGMNFEHMPELQYRWAYPAFLALTLGLGATLAVSFRRRGWL